MDGSPLNLTAGLALSVYKCIVQKETQVCRMLNWSGPKTPPFTRLNIYLIFTVRSSFRALHIVPRLSLTDKLSLRKEMFFFTMFSQFSSELMCLRTLFFWDPNLDDFGKM